MCCADDTAAGDPGPSDEFPGPRPFPGPIPARSRARPLAAAGSGPAPPAGLVALPPGRADQRALRGPDRAQPGGRAGPACRHRPAQRELAGDKPGERRHLPGIPHRAARPAANPVTGYVKSWIVDPPQVGWSRCSVDISGAVRYWRASIRSPTSRSASRWDTLAPGGPAAVTFTEPGGAQQNSAARASSDCFRDLGWRSTSAPRSTAAAAAELRHHVRTTTGRRICRSGC